MKYPAQSDKQGTMFYKFLGGGGVIFPIVKM